MTKKIKRIVDPKWGPWEQRPAAVAQANAGLWGSELVGMLAAYVNRVYSVQEFAEVREQGLLRGQLVTHLLIRRHDGTTNVPWADKQRIKDDLAGPDRLAVEVFPPTDALVDERNLYHLWVFPAGTTLGVSLTNRGTSKAC